MKKESIILIILLVLAMAGLARAEPNDPNRVDANSLDIYQAQIDELKAENKTQRVQIQTLTNLFQQVLDAVKDFNVRIVYSDRKVSAMWRFIFEPPAKEEPVTKTPANSR